MKGDFSRIRFNPAKQYTAVLKQQGRVDLDSDANEQCAIDLKLHETINADVIGEYGGPESDAGFAIRIDGEKIWFSPGRYYVNGILVKNEHWLSYDDQPCLIDPKYTAGELFNELLQAGDKASLGFVLEVWQRLATALDDPCLLEPALGVADTTVRLQTVWRVVGCVSTSAQGLSGGSESGPVSQLSPCCQALYNDLSKQVHTGEMGAGLAQAGSDCGCQPIAAAGYQGLENQLYRVEIHTGGNLTSATIKWSRENASVVTQITGVGVNSPVITVASLGPDANLGFQAGQWVELSDDTYQFGETPNKPGILFQIISVNQATLQVTMTTPVYGIDTTKNARMRRWDQSGPSATASGIPVSGTPIPLENGIQVDFRNGVFQAGDYWTIPARTANGQIDWPPCGSNGSHYQPSSYMQVYQAPLACIGLRPYKDSIVFKGSSGKQLNDRFLTSDCRLLFPPLTAVNADTTAAALHVSAISWINDDVVTTDTLLENGLSVTLDQATTCPWGGGNFQVTIELPYGYRSYDALLEGKLPEFTKPTFSYPPGTDWFIRTVLALDPPFGVTVLGNQVNWITPASSTRSGNYGTFELLILLNTMLAWQSPLGYARVRVRLIGGAIYGSGTSGNIYLDGQSFGQTGNRSMDGSEAVNYILPSGDSATVSDYEGWFYLAPTIFVANVVIQGVEAGNTTNISAVTVVVDFLNQITGLQTGASVSVTNLQVLITLSYTAVAPVTVSFTLTGTGANSIVTIAQSITIAAGQQTGTAPITIIANPGGGVTDAVTVIASVATAVSTLSYAGTPPTLSITGATPPTFPFTGAPPLNIR